MSLSKLLSILSVVILSSCGFSPIYGNNGSATAILNSTLVDEPNTREGYLLTRHLESRLGRASDPRFGLSVTIVTTEEGLNISSEGDIERFNLLGSVEYSLRNTQTGQISASGTVKSFTGYSATGTTVATQVAQQDAQKRLMVILADLIVENIVATVDFSS